MITQLENCIVRIRTTNDEIVGAGFLAGEKFVVTCAHVISNALGIPQTPEMPTSIISLDFPLLAGKPQCSAKVVHWQPIHPDGSGDIAGLELVDVPSAARPPRLANSMWGKEFTTFGFPREHNEGVYARGQTLGKQGNGFVQLEGTTTTGISIEKGFSGSPVWDIKRQAVVGMVVANDTRLPLKIAFMIPATTLTDSWNALAIPETHTTTLDPIAPGSTYIFLSYRSIEGDFASKLAADLKNAGVQLWMDRFELKTGEDWLNTIQRVIDSDFCVGTIAVLSPEYLQSEVCMDELSRSKRQGKPIIPVLLYPFDDEDKDWPMQVERVQYIQFFNESLDWRDDQIYRQKFPKLLETVKERFEHQIGVIPDAETRYLNNLIAQLQRKRSGVSTEEYVEISGEGDAPRKTQSEPDDGWDTSYSSVGFTTQTPMMGGMQPKHSFTSLRETVEAYPSFVIIGDAGTGKSTTLRRLTLDFAAERLKNRRTKPLPLFLRLSSWENELTPADFIRNQWQNYDLPKIDPLRLLSTGEIILLLDGLNEMGESGPDKIAKLRKWLHISKRERDERSIFGEVPKRVIFTCRVKDYTEAADLTLPIVTIGELSDEQIQQFALNYLGEESDAFIARIFPSEKESDDKTNTLLKLAKNPYMLGALTYLHLYAGDGELPRNHGRLFRELALRLWKRESERNTPYRVDFELMEDGFSRLAFAMIEQNKSAEVPSEWAIKQISERKWWQLGGTDTLAENLLRFGESANLIEIQNGRVRFYHQSMQEYFASIKLVQVGLKGRLVEPAISNFRGREGNKWDGVIVALSGNVIEPDALVRAIATIDPWIAAKCIASGIQVEEELSNRLRDMFLKMSRDKDTVIRRAAVDALRVLADPIVIPRLLEMIPETGDVASMWEGEAIVNTLVSFGDDAVQGIIDILASEDDDSDKVFKPSFFIMMAMHRTKILSAVPGLLKILRDGRMSGFVAAEGLGQIGEPALPGLLEIIKDGSSEVRQDAMWGLNGAIREIKDLSKHLYCIPTLIQALVDENDVVGAGAGAALMKFGSLAVPALSEAFKNSDEGMAYAVADVMGHIGGEVVITELVSLLSEPDHQKRAYIAKAFGKIGEPAIPALREKLYEGNRNERIGAAWSLGIIGGAAREELIKALRHENTDICRSAISALASPGNTAAVSSLRELLTRDDIAVRGHAVSALIQIGDVSIIPALIEALADDDNDIRLTSVRGLVQFGENSIPDLLKALHDKKISVSMGAASALGAIGESAKSGLLEALQDDEEQVRFAVRTALGQIEQDPVSRLTETLEDKGISEGMRAVAIGFLARLGSEEAVQRLIKSYQENPSPELRVQIIEALVEISDTKGISVLLQALTDEDLYVRRAAIEGLGSFELGINALPSLLTAFDHVEMRDGQTRYFIAQLIASIKDDCLPLLFEAMRGDNPARGIGAAWSLGLIGSTAVPGLLQMLNEQNNQTRTYAIVALAKIGDAQSVDGLLKTLTDVDQGIRISSAMSLEQIASPTAIPGLVKALYDEDFDVHRAAASALKAIGEPAIPVLLTALRDDNPTVMQGATWTLGEIGESAHQGLLEALNDEKGMVRFSARVALGEIENAQVPRILEALNDEDMQVRTVVVYQLGEFAQTPETQEEAILALLQVISGDAWDLKPLASSVLSELGAPAVLVSVRLLSDKDKPIGQRMEAALALSILQDENTLPILIQVATNQNEHWLLRQRVSWALEAIGGDEANKVLKELKEELPFVGLMSDIMNNPRETPEDDALDSSTSDTDS